MNKLAALLIVSALAGPAFAQETKAPVKKAEASKVATKKPMAKKAKKGKTPAAQTKLSSLQNLDSPWMLPT
jgi:hypothetical protein